MPQLIFKCPYISGGGKNVSHLKNMTNYISTREGVEKITIKDQNAPSTKKQKELIKNILKDFPNTKNLFEYGEYKSQPTVETASDFITTAINLNYDLAAKKENYVNYIANRPQVEKITEHGLFTSGDEKINLSKVAKEISEHEGNIWLPIIALKREDAERMGYDNANSWKLLLEQQAINIAENLKISLSNFHWYAAYHNHPHHPHVHMICYSDNPKEGFLTKLGIKNIKSKLMNHIYENDLELIYSQKSEIRDKLKEESEKAMDEIHRKILNRDFTSNDNLEKNLLKLSERLNDVKGKKVYGYLPQSIKKIVDSIVDELCKEPSIQKSYDIWFELQKELSQNYTDKIIEKPPLSAQKEFKSIKNYIIKVADELSMMNQKKDIDFCESYDKQNEIPLYLKAVDILHSNTSRVDDLEIAMDYLIKSAENGNEYSKYYLENRQAMFEKAETPVSLSVMKLFDKLGDLFESNQPMSQGQKVGMKIDSKRLRKLREKKIALGQKSDDVSMDTY